MGVSSACPRVAYFRLHYNYICLRAKSHPHPRRQGHPAHFDHNRSRNHRSPGRGYRWGQVLSPRSPHKSAFNGEPKDIFAACQFCLIESAWKVRTSYKKHLNLVKKYRQGK